MRHSIFLVLGCALILLSGCSGLNANLGMSGESFTNARGENTSRREWGSPGISFTGNRTQLPALMRADAESYATKKTADTWEKLAQSMRNGETKRAPGELKSIGFVNNDPSKTVFFFHPQLAGMRIILRAGGGIGSAEVTELPPEIPLYSFPDGDLIKKVAIKKTNKIYVFNGVEFNSFTYINKVY